MTVMLAVDLGKTGCRALVVGSDGERRTTTSDGATGLVDRGGIAAAGVAILQAAGDMIDPIDVTTVGVAAAGLGRTTIATGSTAPRADALLDELRASFPNADLAVCSDMTASHAGALAGRPGLVLAAGTGTVALAIGADGTYAVVDGWGYLIGDDGSGFAIGRAGLSAALRAHDGRVGSVALAAAARARFGDLDAVPALVHGALSPAAAVAAFAPDVLAAARDGDHEATAICERAVDDLLSTVVAASAKLVPDTRTELVEVVALGGLLDDAILRSALAQALAEADPKLELRSATGGALDGALLLATNSALPHEPLVRRRPADHMTPGDPHGATP